MTSLLQRCDSLDKKLKSLALAKRHASDQRLIQQRTQEWRDRYDELTEVTAQTGCLELIPEDATAVTAKRATLRQNAAMVLSRLREEHDIKELTRDAAWKRLLKSSEGFAEVVRSSGIRAWRAYLDQQGALEDPATLRQRTPATPQNQEALRAYQESHATYAAIAKQSLPRSDADFDRLVEHVTACRKAFTEITFDLPVEVKRFYEALTAGTATLASVTPAVLKWIGEHGYLERFSVRGMSR